MFYFDNYSSSIIFHEFGPSDILLLFIIILKDSFLLLSMSLLVQSETYGLFSFSCCYFPQRIIASTCDVLKGVQTAIKNNKIIWKTGTMAITNKDLLTRFFVQGDNHGNLLLVKLYMPSDPFYELRPTLSLRSNFLSSYTYRTAISFTLLSFTFLGLINPGRFLIKKSSI